MLKFRMIRKAAVFLLFIAVLVTAGVMPDASAAEITSAAGLVATSSGALNVRSTASLDGPVITKLPTGSYVTLISKAGNWWRVEYAPSSYGYASADYIKYVYGTYPVTASSSTGSVMVRSGPADSYSTLSPVSSGRTVLVLSQNGSWLRIVYNGAQSGYISVNDARSLMAWPVPASHKINQYFGTHKGIDIGSTVHGVPGDVVVAAQQGKVVYSGWLSGYGYVVYINSVYNGQPIQTRYGHLNSAPLVTAGCTVGIGQKIGYMGNTGTSSGVHLHFEVRIRNSGSSDCIANVDSTPVSPLNYIK